jgi:hypothetical protein
MSTRFLPTRIPDFTGLIGYCRSCDCPVASYLANAALMSYRREGVYKDYWASCTNPTCRNHYGKGYEQSLPEWIDDSRIPTQLFSYEEAFQEYLSTEGHRLLSKNPDKTERPPTLEERLRAAFLAGALAQHRVS